MLIRIIQCIKPIIMLVKLSHFNSICWSTSE